MEDILLKEFHRNIKGFVYLSGSEGYETSISLDNGRIRQKPFLIVCPNCVEDILYTIAFSKKNKLLLTVKAGGHSYAGYCLNQSGIVLDLCDMKKIKFTHNRNALYVEMGARWSDVYDYLRENNTEKIAIGGTCLSVGVAGFILGGGYSFVSRSYGLGADSVESLTIVLANGQIKSISAYSEFDTDRELFWACLGGGGGNFGIVINMTIKLHILNAPRILGGTIIYPIEKNQEIISFYNDWVKTVPDTLSVYGYIGNLPDPKNPSRQDLFLRLQPVFNGNFSDGIDLLRPLLHLSPSYIEFYNVTLLEYLDICDKNTSIEGRRAYMRSGMLPCGALTKNVSAVFETYMKKAPSKESFMLWMHQGGKSMLSASDNISFPHRDANYICEIVAVWEENVHTKLNVEWAYEFGEALTEHFTGAFINYIDPLLQNWPQMYYGDNYSKLEAIKKRCDPDNFFRFQQSIGSVYSPSKNIPLDLTPLSTTL